MYIKSYIQNFLARAGGYVFLATLTARLFSFLASWFAIQFIDNKELGVVLFAYNILAFLIPFGDLGLHQSLIRYGALLKTLDEKNSLFVYVFKKGILVSICMVIVITIFGLLFPFTFEKTGIYLAYLSVALIPIFILHVIKIQFRLHRNNKMYAYVEMLDSTLLVLLVLLLSFRFQENGYIIALIITPLLTSLIFLQKLNINFSFKVKLKVIDITFWKYGFFSGLTSVVSNFLFIIDILLIGYLLNDSEMVTAYKYISIIPMSILFLPRMFITTDFVSFTEKIGDSKYIFKYIKSYMLLFMAVSILFCTFFYFFAEKTLALIDKSLIIYTDSFLILTFGVCGILIFRGLFSNLLSSIGMFKVNSYIIGIAILLNLVSNYYLIPIYQIKGAAITSACLMWFTGVFSSLYFFYFYKKIHL